MPRDSLLPLKPQWFHILLALADGERHGFAIVREVLSQTAGALRLWPATLYGSLDRLVQEGLIEELAKPYDHPEGESERRRYYRITQRGREVLAADAERLAALAEAARAKSALSGSHPR